MIHHATAIPVGRNHPPPQSPSDLQAQQKRRALTSHTHSRLPDVAGGMTVQVDVAACAGAVLRFGMNYMRCNVPAPDVHHSWCSARRARRKRSSDGRAKLRDSIMTSAPFRLRFTRAIAGSNAIAAPNSGAGRSRHSAVTAAAAAAIAAAVTSRSREPGSDAASARGAACCASRDAHTTLFSAFPRPTSVSSQNAPPPRPDRHETSSDEPG